MLSTLDVLALETRVKDMYRLVAQEPQRNFHFELGRELALRARIRRLAARKGSGTGRELLRWRRTAGRSAGARAHQGWPGLPEVVRAARSRRMTHLPRWLRRRAPASAR